MKLIIEYLKVFKTASRIDIENLVLAKLPDALNDIQKRNKIKNLLQRLRKDKIIKLNEKREWILNEL